MFCFDICLDSVRVSISLEWHLYGPVQVRALVSTERKAKSVKLWAVCWVGSCKSWVMHFFRFSSLVCFSTKDNFSRGSDASVLPTVVFMSSEGTCKTEFEVFQKLPCRSKWGFINLFYHLFISASANRFWGDPTENANNENVVKLCASASPVNQTCKWSQRFSKALSDYTSAMLVSGFWFEGVSKKG